MDSEKSPQATPYDRPIFGRERPRQTPGDTTLPRPKRRMSLNVKLLLFAVTVLVGLGVAFSLALRPESDRYVLDTFQYTTVGARDFRNLVHTSGRVVPSEVIVLSAPRDAVVVETSYQAGDDVRAGSLLARLHSESLESDLAKARLDLELAVIEVDQAKLKGEQQRGTALRSVDAAREALAKAEAELPVMQELYALGGIPRKEMEDAEAAVRTAVERRSRAEEDLVVAERQADLDLRKAEQQVETHRAKVAELEGVRERLNLIAPRNAKVLESSIEPGDSLPNGAAAFRLADVTTQYVETVVTPEQAVAVSVGAPAVIRTGDAEYSARVAQVAPLAVTGSSGAQVPVRLSLAPEVASRFIPNAPVSVEIELGASQNRPYLARGPFFTSGNASFVYVISQGGRQAERRDVRYGAIDGEYVEVISGLEPGDRIIYSSYTAYRSYRTVELIPEGGRPVE